MFVTPNRAIEFLHLEMADFRVSQNHVTPPCCAVLRLAVVRQEASDSRAAEPTHAAA
jgi:hypothetical protein